MTSSGRRSIPLMEESGQTDEERRLLRRKQRDLQKKIQSNAEAMENPCKHIFSEIREENNNLFQKVFYTREAVLDGESLQLISEHGTKQIEGLVDDVPRYDAMRVTWKLRQKYMRERFDWHTLGVQAGTCFNAIPSRIQFFGGPLHADFVPQKARTKRKRVVQHDDDGEEECPDTVDNQEPNAADQLSAVDRNMKILSKVLKQRSEQVKQEIAKMPPNKRCKKDIEVNAIQYMFDPESFTQTVENMFHFSFLVKNGGAKIIARPDGPKVATIQRSVKKESRQAIVALTMQDWRELCRAYEVEKADVPHRTGSKQVHHFKRSPAVYPFNLETTCNVTAETSNEECVETSHEESVETNNPLNLETNHGEYVEKMRNDDELPDNNTTRQGGTCNFSPLPLSSVQACIETNRGESVDTHHDEPVEPIHNYDSPDTNTASPVGTYTPSKPACIETNRDATVEANSDMTVEANHVKPVNNDNSPDKNTAGPVGICKPSSLTLQLASACIETNRDATVKTNHVKPININNSPDKNTANPAGTYKFSSLTLKLARLKQARKSLSGR